MPLPRSLRLPASRWGRADRRTGRVEAPVPATRPRARHPPVAPPPRRHRRHRRCRRRASTRYQRKLSSRPALRPLPPPHMRRPPRRLSPPLAATAGRHPPPPPSRQVGRRRRRRYRPQRPPTLLNHLTPRHIAARALHWCMYVLYRQYVRKKARRPNALPIQASDWVHSSGRWQSRKGRFPQRAPQE